MTAHIIKKSDRLIPWYFVIFFAFIAIIDTGFVITAIRTQTGVIAENPYQLGLDYDQTLDTLDKQRKLGWSGLIDFSDDWKVSFKLADQHGKNLSQAMVKAHIVRPVQEGSDYILELQQGADGVYTAQGTFPYPGRWNINIEAIWQGHHYYQSKEILVRK